MLAPKFDFKCYIDFYKKDFISDHFVLCNKGKILGIAQVVPLSEEAVELRRFAIIKKYQKQKYGKRFIACLISYLAENKELRYIGLLAQMHNVNFYRKVGFELISEEIINDVYIARMGGMVNIDIHTIVEQSKNSSK